MLRGPLIHYPLSIVLDKETLLGNFIRKNGTICLVISSPELWVSNLKAPLIVLQSNYSKQQVNANFIKLRVPVKSAWNKPTSNGRKEAVKQSTRYVISLII